MALKHKLELLQILQEQILNSRVGYIQYEELPATISQTYTVSEISNSPYVSQNLW